MSRRSARCLLVIVLVQATHSGVAAQDLAARIDRYLASEVEQRGIPGLTAAVVRDGKVIYSGAHGMPKRDGTDQSAAAVASTRATAEANGVADRVEVVRADGLETGEDDDEGAREGDEGGDRSGADRGGVTGGHGRDDSGAAGALRGASAQVTVL